MKFSILNHPNISVEDLSNKDMAVLSLLFSSWGSGANPWGPEKEDQFQKPTHYDGNLEVVGITGVVHMAQIHSGLRTGIRVAQGGHVSTSIKGPLVGH